MRTSKLDIIILVGGRGKRLGKLTKDTPKPILKIKNNVFLDYLLNHIIKEIKYINKIFFIAGYKGQQIKEKYKKSRYAKKFEFIIEKKLEGTGKAIFKYKKRYKKNNILIFNGDTLFKINLNKFIKFSANCNDPITMALTINSNYISNSQLSNLSLRENKIYFSNKEKLMNGGIYFLKKNILSKLRKNMKSFENDFIVNYINKKKVSGLKFNNKFIDIGTQKNLNFARKNFKKLNN